MGIASGIIAGLMYIVVELMGTDQRESSRSETQREMQMALDYMSTELREAVYVYTGDDLRCAGLGGSGCRPLTEYLPASVSDNSTPIIAFWKQKPYPSNVASGSDRAKCYSADPNVYRGISCLASSSYALVVYSLSQANPNNIWSRENARVTRYELSEFNSQGQFNQGYVNPGAFGNFATWPYGKSPVTGAIVNLQTVAMISGRPSGRPDRPAAVLVDFVDTTLQTVTCPDPAGAYSLSPNTGTANSGQARGFYACISVRPPIPGTSGAAREVNTGVNQDIVLYLRGNANGRPGIIGNVFLPALETQVLSRGVLSKRPSN